MFDAFGNYTRIHNWGQDRDNGIRILADRMDAEDNSIAQAFNVAFLRNGVVPMTGSLTMNGNPITTIKAGAAATPSLTWELDPATGFYQPATKQLAVAVNGVRKMLWTETGVTFDTPLAFADGTAPLPSIAFAADPDTGFYRVGANAIGISVNGVKVTDISPTGMVQVNAGVPLTLDSLNSNANKITMRENGVVRGYIGSNAANAFLVGRPSDAAAIWSCDINGNTVNTGKSTINVAGDAVTGNAQLTLGGTTIHWIDCGSVGVAAPTLTNRSVGTKVVLFNALSGVALDYAMGVEASNLWYTAPGHKFYTDNITTPSLVVTQGSATFASRSGLTDIQLNLNVAGLGTGGILRYNGNANFIYSQADGGFAVTNKAGTTNWFSAQNNNITSWGDHTIDTTQYANDYTYLHFKSQTAAAADILKYTTALYYRANGGHLFGDFAGANATVIDSTGCKPKSGTTASAANVFQSADGTVLARSTSSLKYKREIEEIPPDEADAILAAHPIRFKSTSELDDPDKEYYGLVAEEVESIDPRLVHYALQEDQIEVVPVDKEGIIFERRPKAGEKPRPDGVQYERLTVLLLDIVKRQDARIKALEARL